MSNTYSIYKKQLDENKRNFFLLLERLKKSYPQHKLNTRNSEFQSIYNNDRQQVENIFNTLFLLENQIQKNANLYENNIRKKENILGGNKDYYNKESKLYQELENGTRASVPREKEYNNKLTIEQVYLFINIIGTSIIGYYLYKILQ